MPKFTVPRTLRRATVGVLGAAMIFGVATTMPPATSVVPLAKAEPSVCVEAPFVSVRVDCGGDRRHYVERVDHRDHDRGRWPGDWGAQPVQHWRWAKDVPERWWGCVGHVWTDRRYAPDNIIFNDVSCGTRGVFPGYRIGPNGQEQTGLFWR